VVAAQRDPFPRVAGGGFAALQAAGIQIAVGCREAAARALNAPYLKLQEQGEPWVIAKWAMSLDGKIATRTGQSQWISSPESRAVVHALRGRVDAIIVGCGTALADDPLLTARPAGPRPAIRIVLDAHAQLPLTSRLVQTAREVPCLVVAGPQAAVERTEALRAAGCEVWLSTQEDRTAQTTELLRALGRRGCTNVLVEGGSIVLGSWFDAQQIDEVHAFIAPKLIGGREAFSPLAGHGLAMVAGDMQLVPLPLQDSLWGMVGNDMYFRGRIKRDREGESA
jgi:diaminohydroxyphosphoribosylaminopyrimidine deaminase/5-amino-6-(5-phosphoribosylamino)uracil reductase